jgi:hypothetical protein
VRYLISIGFVAAATSLAIAAAPPTPPPTDAQILATASRLDRKNDAKTKLHAAAWLLSNFRARNARLAIPALENSIRQDPDADVRCEVIVALARIAKRLKKPCPLAIVEALLDKDDAVHSYAGIADQFRTFEPGSVEVLLRCAASDREIVRSNSLYLLVVAGGKDKRVRTALDKATRDSTFLVRNSARAALFKVNDKLDDYLRWIVRVHEETIGASEKTPENERTLRNMAVFGMEMQLIEWRDKRSEELARTLAKLLDDDSPRLRGGAARFIGAVYRHDAEGLIISGMLERIRIEKSIAKSACGPHFEKLKVREKLQELRDRDPDTSVRAAARRALERLK